MDNITNIFRVLSDETRLRIVMLLYRERLCVCQLSGVLGLSQPRVSKALGKLRDVGLVNDERQDKFVYYSLSSTDGMLCHIIEGIVESIDEYPVLVSDYNRLGLKDGLLNGCIVPTFLG
ncbi:MAG: metalloregulator ArsR/SmtB family transcription factor [Firmicutes bacterium]|nr:metalloregulator ArsR/SmtB family transcription factor [Bacillota bacterium]